MATAKKAADKDIAQMPPPGEENIDPAEAAAKAKEDTKSDSEKALDGSANARISTGGQGASGSHIPAAQGVGDVAGKTVTSDELKDSTHPLAPKHPLEVPDKDEEKK